MTAALITLGGALSLILGALMLSRAVGRAMVCDAEEDERREWLERRI